MNERLCLQGRKQAEAPDPCVFSWVCTPPPQCLTWQLWQRPVSTPPALSLKSENQLKIHLIKPKDCPWESPLGLPVTNHLNHPVRGANTSHPSGSCFLTHQEGLDVGARTLSPTPLPSRMVL